MLLIMYECIGISVTITEYGLKVVGIDTDSPGCRSIARPETASLDGRTTGRVPGQSQQLLASRNIDVYL